MVIDDTFNANPGERPVGVEPCSDPSTITGQAASS
jgi:hypothetical protein